VNNIMLQHNFNPTINDLLTSSAFTCCVAGICLINIQNGILNKKAVLVHTTPREAKAVYSDWMYKFY